MNERHALTEQRHRQRHQVQADPVGNRQAAGELVLVVVPQRLVVVLGDVVDGFLRVQRIAGGLAVVVDLAALARAAIGGDELEIAQPAGDADADQVGGVQQLRFS